MALSPCIFPPSFASSDADPPAYARPELESNRLAFMRLSTDDSLSQSSVYAIVQDYQGFLWFGTQNGLNRYDAYEVKVFRHDPSQPGSLGNQFVLSLYEDSQNTLWVGTYGGGLYRFDRARERFIAYRHDPGDPRSLSNNNVWEIREDAQGNLWIGTDGGLNRLDARRRHFRRYVYTPRNFRKASACRYVIRVFIDARQRLWLGTDGCGLLKFDPQTEQFTQYRHQANQPASLPHNSVLAINQDRRGDLWLGTAQGLGRFYPATGRFRAYPLTTDSASRKYRGPVRDILVDGDKLWVATHGGGLYQAQTDRRALLRFTHQERNRHSLSSDKLWRLYQDRAGILWIGTDEGGVSYYKDHHQFLHYQHHPDDPNSLAHSSVWDVLEDHAGRLWVATEDGLSTFNPESRGFEHYRRREEGDGLTHNRVYALAEDARHNLWIGSFGGGLNRLNPSRSEFTAYRHEKKRAASLNSNNVRVLHIDAREQLWIGTRHGLNRLDLTGEIDPGAEFQSFTHQSHDPESLSHNFVISLHSDDPRILWVGTQGGGLNRLEVATQRFQRYLRDAEDPRSLSYNQVSDIYRDYHGNLWIATLGGGINRWRPATEDFERFPQWTEHLGYTIQALQGDSEGKLWVASEKGLCRINPVLLQVLKCYDASHGVQGTEFHNTAWRTRQGYLLFGGLHGLNVFHPGNLDRSHAAGAVRLTDFLLFGQSLGVGEGGLHRTINHARSIKLQYDQDFFTFKFAALNFLYPRKSRYRYRLAGFDRQWIEAGHRREAAYTKVPPGNYTFEATAANYDGVWSTENVSIAVRILPVWWQTAWFKLLLILLLLGGVSGLPWLYYRIRLREQQRYASLLEGQVADRTLELEAAMQKAYAANQAKSTFLANMSHELRTPLNAIMGFAQILEYTPDILPRHREKVRLIHKGGQHLLGLINDILDLAKIEAERIELVPEDIDLPELLHELASMFEHRAREKHLVFDYRVESPLPAHIRIDGKRLRQLLINLMGNAVKFTREGRVALHVNWHQGYLHFRVRDSGPGIAPAEQAAIFQPFFQAGDARQNSEGTGLGLAITAKIIALMGGHIRLESHPGEGSCFQVEVPAPAGITPRYQGEAAADAEISGTITGYRLSHGEKPLDILIVDDVADNRAILGEYLAPLGFAIREAENGETGLALARQHRPDLVLMDFFMPGVDGLETTRRLHGLPGLANLPVVMVSAHAFREDIEASLAAGCVAYLAKPVRREEVLAVLAKYLPLQWEYATVAPGSPPGASSPLRPEQREKVLSLQARGAISELEDYLEDLTQTPDCPGEAHELLELARNFQLPEIAERLAK